MLIDYSRLKETRFLISATLWLLSIIFLLQPEINSAIVQISFFVIIFAWFVLNRFLLQVLKLPKDITVFAFIVVLFLDIQLVSFIEQDIISNNVFFIWKILHELLLALQILSLGLILIQNNNQKQRILVNYIFYGLLAHFIIYPSDQIWHYIFYIIIFFLVLRRTHWTDSLPKNTLGIYFVFFVGLVILLFLKDPYQTDIWNSKDVAAEWYSIPKFIFDILKMYVIAISFKIPAVIIYNHINLSRKLWFAGFFQSSIPQIFQFILIVILFFFFLSGWQAQNIQQSLKNVIEYNNQLLNVKLNNENIPSQSIIKISDNPDLEPSYYFYWRDPVESNKNNFILIDSLFCSLLYNNSAHILGNGVLAYPFEFAPWQKTIDNLDLWQKDQTIKIYPFSFFSSQDKWYANYYEKVALNDSITGLVSFDVPGKGLTIGRVFLPAYDQNGVQLSYFSIDMMLNYKKIPVTDPMVGMVLVLIAGFLLANILIIRRMVKTGDKINQTIISKFASLKNGIREISGGNLDYKLHMEGEDEFVELAERFNQMGKELQETISQAREKDRLDQELSIAREVQLSLLPAMLPDISGYEIAAIVETAKEVSGDFYDIVEISKDKVLFTIGDVSGKGASAAFYMAQYISLFRFAAQFTAFPKEIAFRINDYFTRHVQDKHIFITSIIGVLEKDSAKVSLVRAGHNNPYLITQKGDLSEIKPKGIGIGLTSNEKLFKNSLEKYEFNMDSNDILILYTDGVIEATKRSEAEGLQYGEEKFIELLTIYKDSNAYEVLKAITADVNSFYAGEPYNDDLTLFIIRKT